MNVRCPHCSAVFPVGAASGPTGSVECPLCLLRFEPKAEETVSAPPTGVAAGSLSAGAFGASAGRQTGSLNAQNPSLSGGAGGRTGLADEEFEQFGMGSATRTIRPSEGSTLPKTSRSQAFPAVGSGNTIAMPGAGIGQGPGLGSASTAPGSLATAGAGATVPGFSGSRGSSPAIQAQESLDADIDFDALLSDAAAAVGRSSAGRSSPFARVSAPRGGGAPLVQDEVFGAAKAATGGNAALPQLGGLRAPYAGLGDAGSPAATSATAGSSADDDSLFESGSPGPSSYSADAPSQVDSFAQPRLAPSVSAVKSGRPVKKPTGAPALTFDKLLIAAMVVAGAGLAADYAGLGLFASKLWKTDAAAPAKLARPVPPDLQNPVILDDTRKAYELELARLDRLTTLRPDDADIQARRVAVYLDLWERFPAALDQDEVKAGFVKIKAALPPLRAQALKALEEGDFAAVIAQKPGLISGSADDRGVLARALLGEFRRRLYAQSLENPGLTSAAEVDPLRTPGAGDAALEEAGQLAAQALQDGKSGGNIAKFQLLYAHILDQLGKPAEAMAVVAPLVERSVLQHEARLVLASAAMDQGKLDEARKRLTEVEAAHASGDTDVSIARQLHLLQARIAGRLGDREGQAKGLQSVLGDNPKDELATIRLARIWLADKHLDDANKLLQTAKRKHEFKSVGFEVALVEYWLAINRNDDALEEIREATKLHPNSVELLYLRGQVEDKQAHFATARDFFAKVLERQPRHLRSTIRLAELQGSAGRHDEALATLERARAQVGDEETVLRLIADELTALRRHPEAREVLNRLLAVQPDNRRYLMKAAQMDLRDGKSDQALEFLRRLRDQKALDREAAVQMALALADKRSFAEAAQVLEPFADQAPTDIELNALIGRLYIDISALDRATVYVQRAVQTANGKSAEALFQYGRLAFKRGDVSQGISRMKQAIDTDRLAHQYRFELAKFLLDVKGDAKARKVAIDELETIVRSAEGLAKADRPVQNLAEVHRQLARGFMEEHDYQKAAKNLELATELVPGDLEGRAELGKALYFLRDERAGPVLRNVLSRKPGDGKASLYLALHLLGKRRPAEALPLLQSAAQTGDVRFAEAWFHMALIQKERDNLQQALRDVEQYLERGPRDGTYRADAESLRRTLQAAIQGRNHK